MSVRSASITQLAVLVSLAVVTVDFIRRWLRDRAERKGHPLPPGPPLLPFVGSALFMNSETPWTTYTEWAGKYKSDVIYARLLDQDVVILNSVHDAIQLLEKRSQIYSNRPYLATLEPYGHDFSFVFKPYGEYWRLCRRIFHQTFRAEAAITFRPMQLRKSRQMVMSIMEDPDSYELHFSTYAAAVSMHAAWNYDPLPRNDPMVTLAHNFLQASLPGLTPQRAILIKTFPFLLHLPDWLPGSWIKREAKACRDMAVQLSDGLFDYVQKRIGKKEQIGGLVAEHIARLPELDDAFKATYATATKHASVTAFIGAAESTSSTLMTFLLAMVENPHVWKRAHAEMDGVVGADRFPNFEDRESLPYTNAIFREVLRWHPAVPMGVPHAVIRNDIYKGYFIPKGATIITNVWKISHDQVRYPAAHTFIPERFLNADGTLNDDDPAEYIFGFGRRICPGRHTADSTVWIAIATMLAALEFHRPMDETGEAELVFEATFSNSVTHHPEVFPCRLVPRPHIITKEEAIV